MRYSVHTRHLLMISASTRRVHRNSVLQEGLLGLPKFLAVPGQCLCLLRNQALLRVATTSGHVGHATPSARLRVKEADRLCHR